MLPKVKFAGYALLGVLAAVLYANWTDLETRLELTVAHHAWVDPDHQALKSVTVFPNGASMGGVEVQVSAELLEHKNASELAVYFAQFVPLETMEAPVSKDQGSAKKDNVDSEIPTKAAAKLAAPTPTPTTEADVTAPEETTMELPTTMPLPSSKPRTHRLFTSAGKIVRSFADFETGDRLYVAAPGLFFMWPFVERGHRVTFRVPNQAHDAPDIELESISESPRVFRLHNFASVDEAQKLSAQLTLQLASKAVSKPNDDAFQTAASSVIDLYSPLSYTLRKRAVSVLAMGKFRDQTCDGLELARHGPTQGTEAHYDVYDFDNALASSLDPHRGGCNRVATMLTYLSDVASGGETVFPDGDRPTSETSDATEADTSASASSSNWEQELVDECASHLVASPSKTDALLIYNVLPNGEVDETAAHGSCPVAQGTKDTATIWVWNACSSARPRSSTPARPQMPTPQFGGKGAMFFQVTFTNLNQKPVDVLQSGVKVQTLMGDTHASFSSYTGQQWTVKYGDRVLTSFSGSASNGEHQNIDIPVMETTR